MTREEKVACEDFSLFCLRVVLLCMVTTHFYIHSWVRSGHCHVEFPGFTCSHGGNVHTLNQAHDFKERFIQSVYSQPERKQC